MGYTITVAAQLYGLSSSTVARHLPAHRARRGQRANLSREEVLDLAERLDLDLDAVCRRLDDLEAIAPELPERVRFWARVGRSAGIGQLVAAQRARRGNRTPGVGAEAAADVEFPRDEDRAMPATPLTEEEFTSLAAYPEE